MNSLRDRLVALLGRHWYFTVLILAALIVWPLIAFRETISFSAAVFTQEWVKAGLTGIALYLLLDLSQHRARAIEARRSSRSLVATLLLSPLEALEAAINATASQTDPAARAISFETAVQHLQQFSSAHEHVLRAAAPELSALVAARLPEITNNLLALRASPPNGPTVPQLRTKLQSAIASIRTSLQTVTT